MIPGSARIDNIRQAAIEAEAAWLVELCDLALEGDPHAYAAAIAAYDDMVSRQDW